MDAKNGVLKVRRGVFWIGGQGASVATPKTPSSIGDVNIPPHLLPTVRAHLAAMPPGADVLLFPARAGTHLRPSSFRKRWLKACEAAGRPDLHFHDLRHTGATMAASTGATLAELMARLGHTTPNAALR